MTLSPPVFIFDDVMTFPFPPPMTDNVAPVPVIVLLDPQLIILKSDPFVLI